MTRSSDRHDLEVLRRFGVKLPDDDDHHLRSRDDSSRDDLTRVRSFSVYQIDIKRERGRERKRERDREI